MLILTRKPREKVHIGEEITITVISIRGGTVRFGFQAPPSCTIHREEIYERIKRQVRGEPEPET